MVRIGVLSPVTGGFYFGEVLAGITRAAALHGATVSMVQTLDAGQIGDEFVGTPENPPPVGRDQFDGFITVAWGVSQPAVQDLRHRGIPVVLISNDMAVDAASVVVDNRSGALDALRHLVGHGHTRIAFVGNLAQSDMHERYLAYLEGLAEHGLDPAGLLIPTRDHAESGGRAAAEAVAAAVGDQGATAALVATDRIALGLLAALPDHGVSVPEDLAVVGFDDIEPGWASNPPLTTVNQRFADQGAVAVDLLLGELRGESTEHRRHTMPAAFVQRHSCGCRSTELSGSAGGVRDARVVTTALLEVLDVDRDAELASLSQALQRADLDRLIDTAMVAVSDLGYGEKSPEAIVAFDDAYVAELGHLGRRLHAAGHPGAEILDHVLARTHGAVAQGQATRHLDRVTHLARSLVDQYELAMGMLGTIDDDPRTLGWLAQVPVRVACLGLWDGDPEAGRLRICGTYDVDHRISELTGLTCTPEEFPPAAVIDAADATQDEVTYVLPIRGASGDRGFLAIVGHVDTEYGTGRSTYNHWASLLGVALRERDLLEDVRRSEQRHALAARATHDGLWELDLASQELYLSVRCRQILGLDEDGPVGVEDWVRMIVPEDRDRVAGTMEHAATEPDLPPVEIDYRVVGPAGPRWVLSRGLGVSSDGEVVRIVGSLSDVSRRKDLEEQLRQGALYDALTGLPNRRLLRDRLVHAVDLAERRSDSGFAMVFLDLDGFKLINDSLGHLMGDELLMTIGQRLREGLRAVDTAARFGGDEFAVLLSDPVPDEVLVIARRIQERIAEPILLGETEVQVTASVGITTSESGYTSAEDALRDADTAMYHAKGAERGSASVFDPAMHVRATGRLQARSELRTALTEQQFVVHYQPIVSLDGAVVTHFEALVRWEHPERGQLMPAAFLPDLEDTGSIVAMGAWLIDTVCAQLATWRATHDGPVTVAVNLSHREFWSETLPSTLTDALERHQVPPDALVLEITESVIMTDPDAARDRMQTLRELGLVLHIDDVGTGQSSLGALRSFPVDALKIDGSFIRDMGIDRQASELVKIIVAMGRALDLEVVAECVETAAQAVQLADLGCHNAQGWLYARALPSRTAERLLGHPPVEGPTVRRSDLVVAAIGDTRTA